MFRKHQQLQQHQQYYFQQQQYHFQQHHETLRRQMRAREIAPMWASQHQQETAKKTSEAQEDARADREKAQAEISCALPSSLIDLKTRPLSEYSAMLSVPQSASFSEGINSEDWSVQGAQLENMEKGLLLKPAQKQLEEELVRVESERPRQPMQAAQPRLYPPVEGAGGDERGVLGKEQVVAGCVGSVEEQRLPFWEDSQNVLEWWRSLAEGAEQEDSIAKLDFPFDDDGGVLSGGRLVLEDGEQAPPPLLQQQQELLAPTPQESWPPPMMAAEHGSGAGGSGESRLELGRKDIFVDGGCCGDDGGGLSGRNGSSDTTDGGDWERAGNGTGARSRAFWGCEVAGRRLTRLGRAREREK